MKTTISTWKNHLGSVLQAISCKNRICVSEKAINFQAAPIIMKLNFNYSFQGSYSRSPGTAEIIWLFVHLQGSGGKDLYSSRGGECRRFLWQSDYNYVRGRSQPRHSPVSLTCCPPQSERGWLFVCVCVGGGGGGVVIIFHYYERSRNPRGQE